MQKLKLSNGTEIPQLGFGLWMIKDERVCNEAVAAALEAGYRHFDTAQIYTNEPFLGAALKAANVPREELFITTKIWNENMFWDDLIPSFEQSLTNLQTDYVDLLLLHFPVTELREPAWHRMQDIYKSGRAKAIGVSNYTIRHLQELLEKCDIKPTVNQVELHVYLQQPELLEFCKQHDILVEAYSPLAHGYDFTNEVLQDVARKHSKSVGQVMIRWCIQVGTVPLPKSTHKERIQENIDVFDFVLDDEDMQKLASLERDLRTCWSPVHVP